MLVMSSRVLMLARSLGCSTLDGLAGTVAMCMCVGGRVSHVHESVRLVCGRVLVFTCSPCVHHRVTAAVSVGIHTQKARGGRSFSFTRRPRFGLSSQADQRCPGVQCRPMASGFEPALAVHTAPDCGVGARCQRRALASNARCSAWIQQ